MRRLGSLPLAAGLAACSEGGTPALAVAATETFVDATRLVVEEGRPVPSHTTGFQRRAELFIRKPFHVYESPLVTAVLPGTGRRERGR